MERAFSKRLRQFKFQIFNFFFARKLLNLDLLLNF